MARKFENIMFENHIRRMKSAGMEFELVVEIDSDAAQVKNGYYDYLNRKVGSLLRKATGQVPKYTPTSKDRALVADIRKNGKFRIKSSALDGRSQIQVSVESQVDSMDVDTLRRLIELANKKLAVEESASEADEDVDEDAREYEVLEDSEVSEVEEVSEVDEETAAEAA